MGVTHILARSHTFQKQVPNSLIFPLNAEHHMSDEPAEDMIDSGTNAYLHMSRTKLSRQKYAIKTA